MSNGNNHIKKRSSFAEAFGIGGEGSDWAAKYDRIIDEFPFYDPGVAKKYKNRIRLRNRRARALQRAMLKRNGEPNNITELILASFRSFLQKDSAGVFVIYGLMKSGKSKITATFSKNAEEENPGAKTKVTNSIAEMNDAYASLPPHSIIVRDEDLEATGPGSRTEEKDLHNFQKLGREYEVSTIYNFKKYRNIEIANYYFEMFGWNPKTQESRALVRDELGDYMGFIILKVNYDAAYYKQFETEKSKVADQLKKTKGHLGAFGSSNITEMVDRVWNLYKTKDLSLKKVSEFAAFIDEQNELEDLWDISSIVRNKLTARLRHRALSEPKKKDSSNKSEIKKGKIEGKVKLIKQIEYPKYLETVLTALKKRGVPQIKIEAFKLKCQKETYRNIAKYLNIADGSVSNYISDIQQNDLGYAGEDAWDIDLTNKNIFHKMQGGNTKNPDCIVFSDSKCTKPIEVHSIKTYSNFILNKAMTEIGQEEINYAIEHQIPLFVDAYECFNQILRVFMIDLEVVDHQHSSENPCEVRRDDLLNTASLQSKRGRIPAVPRPAPAAQPDSSTPAAAPTQSQRSRGCSMGTAEPANPEIRIKKKGRRKRR